MITRIVFVFSLIILLVIRFLGSSYFNGLSEVLLVDLVVYFFVLINAIILFVFRFDKKLLQLIALMGVLISALNYTYNDCTLKLKTRIFQINTEYDFLSIGLLVFILIFLFLEIFFVIDFFKNSMSQSGRIKDDVIDNDGNGTNG